MKFLPVVFIITVVIVEIQFSVRAFISNDNLKISRYNTFAIQNNDTDSDHNGIISKLLVI